MRGLSAGETANTIKTLASQPGEARCGLRSLCRLDEVANLLYKRIITPAASQRAKISRRLGNRVSCPLVRKRSGPGTKAARPAPQAGHDPAKRCPKQEVYRGWIIADQQTRNGRNILRSSETALERFFWNARLLHYQI